jgi:hypothetical protein
VPGSDQVLGTRKAVNVSGTTDGHSFNATPMPSGRGLHLLPVNAGLRERIGRGQPGDEVTVHLTQRFT